MPEHKAPIVSVFSSLQGEGLFVGKPHLFIRFVGCNLRCKYCDTPEGLSVPSECQIEKTPFSDKYGYTRNPIDINFLLAIITKQIRLFPYYHSIVLTGGEPLLHTAFLKELLPRLAKPRIPIMLETNGTLPAQLKKIREWIDIVSMDIKMPADIKGNRIDIWPLAKAFIKLSKCKITACFSNVQSKFYIKIVITNSCPDEHYQAASKIIAKENRDIPVILQPASNTITHRGLKEISLKHLIEIYKIFAVEINDVRIIPQVNKLMEWK